MRFWPKNKPSEIHWLDYELHIEQLVLSLSLPDNFSQNYPLNQPNNIENLNDINEPAQLFSRYYEFYSRYLHHLEGTFGYRINIVKAPAPQCGDLDMLWDMVKQDLIYQHQEMNLYKRERRQSEQMICWPETYTPISLANGRLSALQYRLSGGADVEKYIFAISPSHYIQMAFQHTTHNGKGSWRQQTPAIQSGILNSLRYQRKQEKDT
tara:strand:- start:86 stop:712 length:627 start_codon:yes stop_codon:yes gene_type:complete